MDLRRVPLADLKNHQYQKKVKSIHTKIDCRHFLFPCQGDKYLVYEYHVSQSTSLNQHSVFGFQQGCAACAHDAFILHFPRFPAGHEDDPMQLIEGSSPEEICMPGTVEMNVNTRLTQEYFYMKVRKKISINKREFFLYNSSRIYGCFLQYKFTALFFILIILLNFYLFIIYLFIIISQYYLLNLFFLQRRSAHRPGAGVGPEEAHPLPHERALPGWHRYVQNICTASG